MTSAATAAQGYRSLSTQTRDPKDLEYDVILQVTRELSARADAQAQDFPGFVRALQRNERLWIEIGTQVAAPDNALPQDLRARLFYMAEFVGQHTAGVLSKTANVKDLIEMNVAVLRGLKGRA